MRARGESNKQLKKSPQSQLLWHEARKVKWLELITIRVFKKGQMDKLDCQAIQDFFQVWPGFDRLFPVQPGFFSGPAGQLTAPMMAVKNFPASTTTINHNCLILTYVNTIICLQLEVFTIEIITTRIMINYDIIYTKLLSLYCNVLYIQVN